ncbi:MAG: saccharopine dehydrogenase [Candidatus Aminicenantes bacterium]|nr:saccharopine dehydrogenase [Candidatus Aminicenantes bacterium]
MKRLLVLGAGFVAGPLVRDFLDVPDVEVAVADIEPERARRLVGDHPRGRALSLDLRREDDVRGFISKADAVVSLVPYVFHPLVARLCLAERKDMVTTSYESEAVRRLDPDARRAGIVILNEVGLDPGIDHMEAKRIIDEVHGRGGRVVGFRSYCGGLPAPGAAGNPFGYKFSWSPRGVLMAGRNPARFLQDGREVVIPAGEIFFRPESVPVDGLGEFEGYPNRDSMPYVSLYGIPEVRTMFRGTLRWPGWCETLKLIGDIGYLDDEPRDLAAGTYRRLTALLLGRPEEPDPGRAWAARTGRPAPAAAWERLEWLGLLSERPVPERAVSALDALEHLMVEKLSYGPRERDMIVLRHEFRTLDPDGGEEGIVSTLVDFGLPGGPSAMARTVAYPAASALRLILDGRISAKGVLLPVRPEIYGPVLDDLRRRGIIFREGREKRSRS